MTNAQVDKIAVTTAVASASFSPALYKAKIKNTGSTACYINFNADATTSHFKLDPDDELDIGLNTITTISAITSSGSTTVRIIGASQW